MSDIAHFPSFSVVDGDMRINVDMSRINSNLRRAQQELDIQIMNDMLPYMPLQTGILQQMTRAESALLAGTGTVYAAAGTPYGRFLYMGKVMVDPVTNSPWARKDAKKVLTDRDLQYHRMDGQAQAFWFDAAKADHGAEWIEKVKKIVGA